MTPGPENYKELLLFLATAGVIVPLFGRLKLSPIFGFLAAGIVLGPFGLGALAKDVSWLSAVSITDVGQIAPIAEFGVAFLLFMIALELSWNRLIGMRRLVFGLGALQVVVSAVALAIIASWLGQSPASAAVIGSALAMSSTAIILPSLAERKRLNTTAGRASFAVLLFQDLSVAPLLFMVAMLVGARLDLSQIIADPAPTIGVAAGFVAVKAITLFPIALLMGLAKRAAGEVAIVLGPGGEFALILIGAAVATNIVSGTAGATTTVAATLTMVTIPLLIRVLGRDPRYARPDEAAFPGLTPQHDDGLERVIIVGYGRVGQLVADMLARHKLEFLAIDAAPALVARERSRGKMIFYGDATRIDLLRRCGIQRARALVVTLDNAEAVESVVRAARSERPDLTIVARARDAAHASKLYDLKVTDAVPETIEASLQLSEAALIDIGIPMGPVIASIHEKRDEFRRMLQAPERERHAFRTPRPLPGE